MGAGKDDLIMAKQHGRLEVAKEVYEALHIKPGVSCEKLSEGDRGVLKIVLGIIKRTGAVLEEAGVLAIMFHKIVPDADTLKVITRSEADGWQLKLAKPARDENGPAKMAEFEGTYGRNNVTTWMGGGTDEGNNMIPIMLFFVKNQNTQK